MILIIVPILLLMLFPVKVFRRLLVFCCSYNKLHAVHLFVNTFQGHYKDGTSGSRDYRAVSGISFFFRTLLFCFMPRNMTGIPTQSGSFMLLTCVLVLFSLLYGVVQPCKKKSLSVWCTGRLDAIELRKHFES